VARGRLIDRMIVLLVAVALVGVVLFVLGLMGVADPGLDSSMDPVDPGPSPLIMIGLIMIVLGSLLAYTTHLISRE
jgi:hypothetical protein